MGAMCSLGWARDDVVLAWNEAFSDLLVADTGLQNPGMASRSMAMMNIAMYDAINCVTNAFEPMYSQLAAPSQTSQDAAAAQAAYEVLKGIYPGQSQLLDARRSAIMSALPDGVAKSNGIQLGADVGSEVLRRRANDGSKQMVTYQPQAKPGTWSPDPLNPQQMVWGPEWGNIETFVVPNASTFLPPPMPDLTSQEYAQAFAEVKELGAIDSTTRTAQQTETGLFWAYDRLGMGTPMRQFNQIMSTVARDQNNSLSDNAKMFAMASTAVADAGITAWRAKFVYDFWRPVTGIREAATDGNPSTEADPTWIPLGSPGGSLDDGSQIADFTPPFPTYISGHATFAGALFQSLANFYGTDEISFEVQSDEVPGVTRTYERFSDAAIENGRSRVYLGIHWNFDDWVGRETGMEVANYVSGSSFQAVPEPQAGLLVTLAVWPLAAVIRRRRVRPTRDW